VYTELDGVWLQMGNRTYGVLVKFDSLHAWLGVRRRLALYVQTYGYNKLDYYIAKLSHEIYPSRGIRGHLGRQKIRVSLKKYAISLIVPINLMVPKKKKWWQFWR
jgi:hypothetical protein